MKNTSGNRTNVRY